MDFFSRLSDYELFGHLSQGFLLLAGVDAVFGTNLILNTGWELPTGVAITFLAYVAGHIVASPSSLLLERGLARGALGSPLRHLLSGRNPRWWQNFFFPGYFRSLPTNLVQTVALRLRTSVQAMTDESADSVFWQMYPVVKGDEATKERLATFLRLYGFCRNTAFVALILGTSLIVTTFTTGPMLPAYPEVSRLVVALAVLGAGYILFLRYLKFYRAYTVEVTSSFVRLTNPPLVQPDT